jgi:hypothetical protein
MIPNVVRTFVYSFSIYTGRYIVETSNAMLRSTSKVSLTTEYKATVRYTSMRAPAPDAMAVWYINDHPKDKNKS